MSRNWTLALLALPLACTCYERPEVRDLNAIGAPSVTTTERDPRTLRHEGPDRSHVVAHGEPTLQARQQAEAARPETPPVVRTTRGTLEKNASGLLVIGPVGAESLELHVDRDTSVLLDGRVVSPAVLPEGSEVRASWLETPRGKRAQRIEVLPSRPTPRR